MHPQTLITGATGFIGRQLTHDLISQGESVRVLARSREKAQALFGDAVDICEGDVGDEAVLESACRGVETIYHIAGTYRFGLRQRRELWRTNVDGAENLMRSAWRAGVGKVVHLSSGGLLRKGDCATARLIDETDFPQQAPRFCPYKASKWHAEKRMLAWAERGLPVSIASTTCPIGRGDETPTPTGRIVRDFLRRQFPFYCRTGLNFIGTSDLSQGLQRVAQAGRRGERYLLCDENLELKDFLQLLALETGLSAPKLCLPDPVIRLIGFGGEVFDLLSRQGTSARVCLETALQARYMQFFSNAKAREELGWKPLNSIQENISEAVAWFRNEAEVELAAGTPAVEPHVR